MKQLLSILAISLTWIISAQQTPLEVVNEFVTSDSLIKNEKAVADLNHVPEKVLVSFRELKLTDKEEFEKSLTLMFLRLYSAQLHCCRQSYELRTSFPGIDREKDPLLYEFNELSGFYPKDEPVDFISSSVAYHWISQNPRLLKDPRIRKVVEKIEQIQEEIRQSVKNAEN